MNVDDLTPSATVDLGAEEVHDKLVDGFFSPERVGRRNVSWSEGKSSSVSFRLKASSQPYVLAFLAEPYANVLPLEIALSLNGTALGDTVIKPGWQAYRVPIAANLLRVGSNKLALTYSRTARPADVEPDSPDVREISVRFDQLQLLPLSDHVQLSFDMRDAFSRSAMTEGWGVDENDRFAGIWTVGPRAVVRADLTKSTAATYSLRLTAQARSDIAEQEVRVVLNGADLGVFRFQGKRATHELKVPAASVREQNEIALAFEGLKAPSELNPKTSDTRLLGLRVLSLELVPDQS